MVVRISISRLKNEATRSGSYKSIKMQASVTAIFIFRTNIQHKKFSD